MLPQLISFLDKTDNAQVFTKEDIQKYWQKLKLQQTGNAADPAAAFGAPPGASQASEIRWLPFAVKAIYMADCFGVVQQIEKLESQGTEGATLELAVKELDIWLDLVHEAT